MSKKLIDGYHSWRGMRKRCLSKTHKNYSTYGGAGIGIEKKWDCFWKFYEDMGPKPSPKHSIDRIDNTKGYSKENCRWALHVEQMNNTSRTVFINGKTLRQISNETKIPLFRIRYWNRIGRQDKILAALSEVKSKSGSHYDIK